MKSLLPSDWVDYVFSRLTVRYGRAFLDRWNGIDLALVKADWAAELAGFTHWTEAIDHALDHLPADGKPPTVNEFAAMCYRAPKPDRPALPEPKADPARIQAEVAKLQPARATYRDPKSWADPIIADYRAGVRNLNPTRVKFAFEARGLSHELRMVAA